MNANDKATEGSFLAVMADGRHVRHSSYYFRYETFKADVRAHLNGRTGDVLRFFYAYGIESQEYTVGDVAEVFFGQ